MHKNQVKHEETRFRILTEVSQQITSILDINELLEQVVRLIQKTFDYYHVGIGLVEGDEVVYRLGAGTLWDNPDFQFKPARLKVGSEGITGWVAKTGKPALIPDVAHDPRYVWMQGSQTRSELTVPISVKNQVIGVLDVQSDQLNNFDEADVKLISSLANQTGVAIENARLFSTEQRRAEQFRVLTNVSQQITSILDIDDLLKQLVDLVQRTFGYYQIEIGMIEGDDIVFRVGAGELWEKPGFAPNPSRLKVGNGGITGWVAATGKAFVSPDISKEPKYVPNVVGSRTQSELTVPIIAKGRVIGVLDVEGDKVNAFDETDVELISSLANQVGIAIENARLFAETQRLLKETEQRANTLSILNSVQQGLASKLDVQSIYNLVGDTFRDMFDAQVVVISTYDPQSNSIEHLYAIDRGVNFPWPGKHPPGGFRSQIIQTRQPFLLNTNVAEEAIRLAQPVKAGTEMPKSWLGVPILAGDQVTGILSVQNLDRENAFNESDVRLLQTFSASMSIALENARLYEQARHIAVLEERQRLARELHDSVTQSLYGIELYSQAALGNLAVGKLDQVDKNLKDIHETSQEALAEMRLLIYELRPPILEEEGLVAVLQARLSAVEGRAGLKIKFKSDLTERVSIVIEEGLCHIAQEALNNVLKHAHAQNISVHVGLMDGKITLAVIDDGVGFDLKTVSQGGLGLGSMREHAEAIGGKLSVFSQPNHGTKITVEVEL